MKPIGKYEVIAEIATGATGSIYRAWDQVLDREVALKVLRTDADIDHELKERFYREARAWARLAHPNIITVYDLGEADGNVYIAMELLSGSDLRRILQENRPFNMAEKLELMAQVCDALEHVHGQQLVHRDIKPSNIFVCGDQRAKVLDFGIAGILSSNRPNYMAPEQIRDGKCDSRSDLFAAATVFYEFLVRAHPFQHEFVASPPDSLRKMDPEIPEALEALLLKGLEKDPEKRIKTAGEFASGLRAILETLRPSPVAAVEDPAEQRFSKFLRLMGDFDERFDRRDLGAARAALEQMRGLAAADSRFVQAVSDCEARLAAITVTHPNPASTPPTEVLSTPATPVPPKEESARPATPSQTTSRNKNLTAVAVVAGIVILLAVSFGWLRSRRAGEQSVPVIMEPEVATAIVTAATTDLLGTPSASAMRLAVLKQGQSVNVLAIPDAGNREFTKVQPAALAAGFVRTADLSNWSGKDAEAAFSLLALFAPAETASESELTAQVEKWNEFIARFPASPQKVAANLESARLEVALSKMAKNSGKPAAEWQSHIDRAKKALAGVTGSPEVESQAAQLRAQLVEPVAPPITPPVTTTPSAQPPERILRTRVNSLWEDGKYEQAMQLVNQILATSPNHGDALAWKKRIRASQEAEARAQ